MQTPVSQPNPSPDYNTDFVSKDSESTWIRLCTWVLGATLLVRIVAMFSLPLTDTTEARYAEIARKMLETNNWVTLWHDYGIPFWAKPPLSTWVSAASMWLFGINEFAARLPNLLLMITVVVFGAMWSRQYIGRQRSWLAGLILGTMLLIFTLSGTVMTDICLVAATNLTMITFWQARFSTTRRKQWGYLMFASLGLGLLAKGPIAVLFPGFVIFCWSLWNRDFLKSLTCLPWIGGILLMLAIALPWYLLAEHRTPGFLDYFIVGEHFDRFMIKGWNGDRYGHAHEEPIGTIVIYWFEGTLPWVLAFLTLLLTRFKAMRQRFLGLRPWHRYLLGWSLIPMIFFPARNIIPTYPLMGLPAFGLLVASLWPTTSMSPGRQRAVAAMASFSAIICIILVGMALALPPSYLPKMSQLQTVESYQALKPAPDEYLYYLNKRYYSAEFYSHGHSRLVDNWDELEQKVAAGQIKYLAVQDYDLKHMPEVLRQLFAAKAHYGNVTLFALRQASADEAPRETTQ